MAWLNIKKAPLIKSKRSEVPDAFWMKCSTCGEICSYNDLEAHHYVCPSCQQHFAISARKRVELLVDEGTFKEYDASLRSVDVLNFVDVKSYSERLNSSVKALHTYEALLSGSACMLRHHVQLAIFDFSFMGGSMGSVVGEKITRAFLRAYERREPVIIFSTSGGARMQEGLFSLMQMAKTCSALNLLKEAGLPFISVMTHPTTGGVAASYAMLGDINIAEPGSLIGFAGPRVIKQTIGQSLPEGFQKSEYLSEHGMLDVICSRSELRHKIIQILDILSSK